MMIDGEWWNVGIEVIKCELYDCEIQLKWSVDLIAIDHSEVQSWKRQRWFDFEADNVGKFEFCGMGWNGKLTINKICYRLRIWRDWEYIYEIEVECNLNVVSYR